MVLKMLRLAALFLVVCLVAVSRPAYAHPEHNEQQEAAERRFFDRWSAAASDSGQSPSSPVPPLPRASLVSHDILGSFPQPGASR